MPANVSQRVAITFALIGLFFTAFCTRADAQLQWQSTGVEQASHNEPARRVERLDKALRPAPRQSRPQAKPPTTIATNNQVATKKKPSKPATKNAARGSFAAQRAAHSEQVAQQASAILQSANGPQRAYRPPTKRQPVNQGVEQACHDCGCDSGHFDGVQLVDPSFGGCGVDCGVGCSDSCGCGDVACGGPCCGNEGCCGECGCGGNCGACSYESCRDRGAVPLILFVPPIRELTFSAGVQGFKGPLDGPNNTVRDRGNFGFNESVNLGGPMSWLPWKSLGYQLGYRATHSQLHGSSAGSTAESHTQHFITAGLFRRKPVGLQYGVVYDFLQDERIERVEFGQIRGLISVTNPKGLEWGFQFARGTQDSDVLVDNVLYEPVDQYLLFCRKNNPCGGGELRLFGGVTDDSKGIFGGDVNIPLGDRLSYQGGFTYLIPQDDEMGIGAEEEHWNLGMNLVWHYGKRAKKSYRSPFRPLFNVADNGSFLVDDATD